MIDPGRFRDRIDILDSAEPDQTAVGALDGDPFEVVASDVPAQVEVDAGRTDVRAGAEEPQERATILIRRREVPRTGRIRWQGVHWTITGQTRKGDRHRYIEIEAYRDG